jgi:formylglycine-generating enzyme required for sulfatase activity
MKRTVLFGFVLMVLFAGALAAADDGFRTIDVVGDLNHKSGRLGNYRALIIGIDDYKDRRIPDLRTAVNDARAMAGILKDKYGFQVELMLGGKATRAGVYQALRRLSASAKPGDSVLIYYAGHGDLDCQYDEGWWIPVDAEAGNPVTYLDNTNVQKAMRNMKASHVLLISDSCYSGTLFGRARAMPGVITDKYYLSLYNEKSRWGMTSGNKTPVSDEGDDGHSIFAYQLLKELGKNEKPYLSTQELYTRIAPIVGNNSEQTPLCSPIRNTGDRGGEFIFVASSGATVSRPVPSRKTTLSVSANVTGARVLVDGRSVGQTPLDDKAVKPGTHRLRVEAEGYDAYEKRIRVESGRAVSLYVDLSEAAPSQGRLFVETTPGDALVRILNISPAFYQGMELDPGRYHVEVSSDGYETEKRWVSLSAGEDEAISMRLTAVRVAQPEVGGKKRNSLGMEFVYVSPGSFMMGSPSGESDRDGDEKQHRVTLTRGYYMQTTEVTQGQWRKVMGSKPWSGKKYIQENANNAAAYISWNDCQAFIRKLNQMEGANKYRLPTEAEWEYACRAGSSTRFCFGDSDGQLGNYAWYRKNARDVGDKYAHAVGTKRPNAWGLYDMHGNVREWCQDWSGNYPSGSVTDPTGPSSGSSRVYRGGSWNGLARNCRSAHRYRYVPGYRYYDLGFRLAFSPGQ